MLPYSWYSIDLYGMILIVNMYVIQLAFSSDIGVKLRTVKIISLHYMPH